jgi:hypothetical protein
VLLDIDNMSKKNLINTLERIERYISHIYENKLAIKRIACMNEATEKGQQESIESLKNNRYDSKNLITGAS